MSEFALLIDGVVVPTDDLMTWAREFVAADRRVAQVRIGETEISTVFLGINHAFVPGGAPLWFETLCFGGALDGEMERYATLEAAMAGHERMAARVSAAGESAVMLSIDVHDDLKLSADELVGAFVAVLGVRGSGKSNTAAVLLEALLPYMAGTIIDIDGEYYGLKAMYPALVIAGGSHADTPLSDPARLARRSFQEETPVILDFSDARGQAMMDFLLAYLDELWALSSPEAARKPYLLMVEEGHKFVPQGRETEVKDVLRDFSARGRKRGVTLLLVSQRSQKVDKEVLTLTTHYFFHQVFHPRDVATYQEFIPRPAQRVEQLVNGLGTGEAIYRAGNRVQVVTIRQRQTFHAGATPKLRRHASDSRSDEYEGLNQPTETIFVQKIASESGEIMQTGALDEALLVPADGEIAWMRGISLAWEVIALLSDVCERITVGGSLRRGKPFVGDVEVIAMPGASNVARFRERCERLLASGRFTLRLNKLERRIAWGERFRAVLFRGFPLDLFIVQPDRQWGPTCLIRTGSGAANECLVTTLGIRNRLGDAGVLPTGMAFSEGGVTRDGVRLDTPEEWDVFEACGLPWVEPGLRSVPVYQSAAKARQKGAEVARRAIGDVPIRWEYVKFEGRYYWLDVATLLERRADLAAEVESLKYASEVERVEQRELM